MNNAIELLFANMPGFNGSLAVDLHPWTFILGASRQRHVVSSQGKVWKEYTLWLGPLAITITLYGGEK